MVTRQQPYTRIINSNAARRTVFSAEGLQQKRNGFNVAQGVLAQCRFRLEISCSGSGSF